MIKKENLFAEFLLKKFAEESETNLQVCTCENFSIIKGYTTSPDVLPINKIIDEFNEKYPDHTFKNTIDLIDYKDSLETKETISFTFSHKFPELHSTFFSVSDFPFGCSSFDKTLYFYFKCIFEKIPTEYPFDWINFKITKIDKFNIDFEISDNYDSDSDGKLKSLILDSFDFNLEKFYLDLKKMDLENYILNTSEFDLRINSENI